MSNFVQKASSFVIIIAGLLSVAATSAEARPRDTSVVEMQEGILDAGTQQAIHSIEVARRICLAAGGTWDASRVRTRTHSETSSRVEYRERNRYPGYNTIHLDLNRVIFGQPRLPQDYTNEVSVEVDTDDACR